MKLDLIKNKMLTKIINKLYILLFIVSCTTLAAAAEYKINKVLQSAVKIDVHKKGPAKNGHWTVAPNIYVCVHAPVSQHRLERALDFWKKLGYSFGDVYYNDESFGCVNERLGYGGITIDLIGQKFKEPNIGMTWNWKDNKTNEIVKSRIEMKNSWGRSPRVLEHEIGHALGWLDFKKRNHIMNHSWIDGGIDTHGLRHTDECAE
tara:strand:+ start:7471 stop:8085 length:615 start_codon:yes stop_codon:yes gene_type:complete